MLEEEVFLESDVERKVEEIVGSHRINSRFYLHFFSEGVDEIYDVSYRNGLRNLGDFEFLDLDKTKLEIFVERGMGALGDRIYEAKARLTRSVLKKGGTHGIGYNLRWDKEGNVFAEAVPVRIYDSSEYIERE